MVETIAAVQKHRIVRRIFVPVAGHSRLQDELARAAAARPDTRVPEMVRADRDLESHFDILGRGSAPNCRARYPEQGSERAITFGGEFPCEPAEKDSRGCIIHPNCDVPGRTNYCLGAI